MPSPVEDRPGLLIRDPFGYSEATLIFPPPLIPALECFDGERSELDLRSALVQITGELDVTELLDSISGALDEAGFLENERFAAMRDEAEAAFSASPYRLPAHAGTGYPEEAAEAAAMLDGYYTEAAADSPAPAPLAGLIGIAAPHVSPFGGWQCYADAYRALPASYGDRTFVVLGTSHYGEPERFGLTRKPFVTPFGVTTVATELIDKLAANRHASIQMEDYCHAVEHSIEFQILFLQHLYGPEVRVLPILCGSFAHSIYLGGMPEDHDGVKAFLDSLGELAEQERDRLCWVLGIDMAHIGRRYGDDSAAQAESGHMLEVADRDRRRIAALEAADAGAFWDQVQTRRDDLRWCGSSPLYTFLRAVPGARANLLRYEQWNIDPASVVSFAGMTFGAVS